MVAALFMEYQRIHAKSFEVTNVSATNEASGEANVEAKTLSSAATQELNEKERF